MRNVTSRARAKLMVRVALVALMSAGAAACSSDSTRFGENPFSNPFSFASAAPERAEPRHTASIRPVPSGRVERAPLAALPPAQSAPMRGFEGQAQSRAALDPASTGSLPPVGRPYAGRAAASSNWSAEGGTAVTLGAGETVHTLSQRYGVPASAIMQANNLSNADQVGPGTRVVIPVYSSAARRAASAPAVEPAPARVAAAPIAAPTPARVAAAPAPGSAPSAAPVRGSAHTVAPGETLSSLSRQYGVSRTAIADANGLSSDAMVRTGQKLTIPGSGAQMAAVRPTAPVAPAAAPGQPKMQFVPGPQAKNAPAAAAPTQKQASAQPALKPSVGAEAPAFAGSPAKPTAAPEPSETVKTASVKVDPAPAAAPAGPSFRWPVRGRVISQYGSKANGSQNDGINLAVPEGTEVKASDDGVVAYAGSELKGFGNLVLIRHSNGWVTAYAHNSALEVKRGDTIRRGQVIAKSGSTGNVTSPQLHFEVRKGASAVDPMDHLPGV